MSYLPNEQMFDIVKRTNKASIAIEIYNDYVWINYSVLQLLSK